MGITAYTAHPSKIGVGLAPFEKSIIIAVEVWVKTKV